MRNTTKKVELAKKHNTKVIYCNVPETQILLHLSTEIDKLYNYIRKNAGLKLSVEDAEIARLDFISAAKVMEDLIINKANQMDFKNVNRSGLLSQVSNLSQKSKRENNE